jgi:hypothetical protein
MSKNVKQDLHSSGESPGDSLRERFAGLAASIRAASPYPLAPCMCLDCCEARAEDGLEFMFEDLSDPIVARRAKKRSQARARMRKFLAKKREKKHACERARERYLATKARAADVRRSS